MLSSRPASAVPYKQGSFHLVPKSLTVDKKIAVRGYQEMNKSELSHRTYRPQKHYFAVSPPPTFEREYQRDAFHFKTLETKLIWKAFDTPELIGVLLHDEAIRGHGDYVYSQEFLDAAEHWTQESRYWRCIGISKPFFNESTLRVHCWEDNGAQTGTLRLSQAMRHALIDLERAYKRKELGLSPNYVWDQWGPSGFIDGRRSDYLPRFAQNPYIDPDNIEVTELDVAPFNTHEQIRERYAEFIEPQVAPYEHVFLAQVSDGPLTLKDLGNERVENMYQTLNPAIAGAAASQQQRQRRLAPQSASAARIDPSDLRTLMYLVADPDMLDQLGNVQTWAEVKEVLRPIQDECDVKINAARMLNNTRHDVGRVRRFYEETCGFPDFMNTPDKEITGAVLAYLRTLKSLTADHAWGKALAQSVSDQEAVQAIGSKAFQVYRLVEDLNLDKRRRMWATRFAGEANEEASLDYLLENFGRRTEQPRSVGSRGGEFDREQEPIGRQVQRRVLDTDLSSTLSQARKSKGRIFNRKKNVFSFLHEKQMQNSAYGVR